MKKNLLAIFLMLMASQLMADHARVSFSANGNYKIKVRVNGTLINDYPMRYVDIPHAYEGMHDVTVRVFDDYGFRFAHKQRVFFKRGVRNRFRLGQDGYGYPILRRAKVNQGGLGVSYYYSPGDRYGYHYGPSYNAYKYGGRYGRRYNYGYRGYGWKDKGKHYSRYGKGYGSGKGKGYGRGHDNRRHHGYYEAEKDVDKEKNGKQKQNADYQGN